MLPNIGALRGMFGIQIVRVQSDNGGEFINQELQDGCQQRGVYMSQSPPYQPQSNGLIERMVGIVKDHMNRVLHASKMEAKYWPFAAMYVADLMRRHATSRVWNLPAFG